MLAVRVEGKAPFVEARIGAKGGAKYNTLISQFDTGAVVSPEPLLGPG